MQCQFHGLGIGNGADLNLEIQLAAAGNAQLLLHVAGPVFAEVQNDNLLRLCRWDTITAGSGYPAEKPAEGNRPIKMTHNFRPSGFLYQ